MAVLTIPRRVTMRFAFHPIQTVLISGQRLRILPSVFVVRIVGSSNMSSEVDSFQKLKQAGTLQGLKMTIDSVTQGRRQGVAIIAFSLTRIQIHGVNM